MVIHHKVVFLTFQKYSTDTTVTYRHLSEIPNVNEIDYVMRIKPHFYKSHVYNSGTPILLLHQ